MLSCRTNDCQLLCLKKRGRTTLHVRQRSSSVNRKDATHLENSVGLGHVNIVPSDDQYINPVFLISSSSNIAYSFPTKAACVLSGGLSRGCPEERLKEGGGEGRRDGVELEGWYAWFCVGVG